MGVSGSYVSKLVGIKHPPRVESQVPSTHDVRQGPPCSGQTLQEQFKVSDQILLGYFFLSLKESRYDRIQHWLPEFVKNPGAKFGKNLKYYWYNKSPGIPSDPC